MMPDAAHLYAVIEGTWPDAGTQDVGPWVIRDGQGGGKRVSAAVARQAVTPDDLPLAEAALQTLGQAPLFMIREGEAKLDAMLDAAGYRVVDPVNMYVCPISELTTERPPRVTAFDIWEPLAIMRDIWAAGGIGTERLAVMARASGPKTGLLGRGNNQPAAAGFVAIHDGIAMVHALEVLAPHRRTGMGGHLMVHAAFWAAAQGASHMSVVCTKANMGANALYTSMGLRLVGHYHYRKKG